ncbi:MAG: ribonuclease H-like domain-containing protein [Bradyrhizobium sp.]|uniref:ribonuclease H-like domain-containing protein n=1 Tax=Bradyrhizobium sp. TaxID=376 RepID=UPI00347CDB74
MFSLFDADGVNPPTSRTRVIQHGRKGASPDVNLSPILSRDARVLFLDVETTGLSWFYDEITIIGWAIDGTYKVLVKGEDPTPLLQDLASATVLVTFNGTLFDLRFLQKTFGELVLPGIHVDLRYLSRRVGLAGGQKSIERELQIDFRNDLEDVDGAAAVLLWHDYLRGSLPALQKLVLYNRSDVLGMAAILDIVMARLNLQRDFWLQPQAFEEIARRIFGQPAPAISDRALQPCVAFRSFASIFSATPAEHARIVGIDLTGSEKRGSGWCVLEGAVAETLTVHTDEEMVSRIIALKPDLVSIDSPLSLPFGRIVVTDDDPGRQEYGIMRKCERELKRRGVNVYPALLPSMQGLTRRGMLLAARVRSEGIPVIESYPGAAQDIMTIPRKGAGIEYLKRGLSNFGIKGPYVSEEVTHDELDAITAALVGSFFLADKYEALSGPTEGALIVPKLTDSTDAPLVVGISGRICSGKTTAARMLEEQGFAYTRFSMVIDDEITGAGETPNRATRQQFGERIHREKGQRWLCERVLQRVGSHNLIVIDGLRFPEDRAYFVETFGSRFIHLHISASDEVRRARYAETAAVSFEVADGQPVEAGIGPLAKLARINLTNEGSLSELKQLLNQVLLEISKSGKCLSQ